MKPLLCFLFLSTLTRAQITPGPMPTLEQIGGIAKSANLSDLADKAQAKANLGLTDSDIRAKFSLTGFGSYNASTGQITITTPTWAGLADKPSLVSQFTNDANYQTLSQLNTALAGKQNSVTSTSALSILSLTTSGNLESTGGGLILKSPNGTRYKLIVSDAGTLSTTTP